MIDILNSSAEVLTSADYLLIRNQLGSRETLVFEDSTKIGFIFSYPTAAELSRSWQTDSSAALSAYTFALRRAGQKAWNTYLVLLAGERPTYKCTIALAGIEEDLTGTRKIARAGMTGMEDLRAALLPLLPLQSAPRLEAVDIEAEIRQRTTELHAHSVDAFLSNTEETIVLQILEEAS